ncbi:extended synaptotagmin-2 isoform X2 [Corythoichthys intestinalis]|uniref:extended synaptotagmin-2 isoform X2 n=1 Tax=Corythoichthys intestinalis TaxID=161448 RepID=UPI0025A50FF0|nr:extended synaptotagmin-2 isoform X2 [Corythoichthys intestinalis]XP_061809995.1 extended synaptotagmin-2-like [Nerophis lumbriciformis]
MSRDSMTAVRAAHGASTSTAAASPKENGGHAAASPAPPVARFHRPSAGNTPGDDTQASATSELTQTWVQFAKTFVLIFPIYALGYFEFSFSWMLIGLVVYFWWRRNAGGKRSRLSRALALLEQEERSVATGLSTSDLPPWVHFPDVERVEWLNKTVKQMWPYICKYVEKLFRDTVEPAVKESNAHLSTFRFSKIDIGDKPLRVNGVKVYSENVDRRQIVMDLQISFVGNTEIDVDIKRYYCKAGIKSIQIHGVLRVLMEPLLGDVPLVGALSLFFLKKPLLDINWTGLTNILDIPGLTGLSDSLIQDIISSYLVLPNRITIPLVGDVELAQLRFPMPKGVLRIHFLEAQDLEGKDKFLGGLIKGKSDPYGILQIGNQLFQSKTIKESLHPKWNEVYEALVYEHTGQHLEIELFDEDPDKDDFLGSLMIDMTELHKEQKVDEWFDLEEAPTGKLHLKLEWLSLLSTTEKLEQVLRSVRADRSLANDGLSSALLVVYLDSAKNLPSIFSGSLGCGNLSERRASGLVFCESNSSDYRTIGSAKKSSSEPSPFVQLTIGHKTQESKIRYKTKEPLWEDSFSFLVHNPRRQELEVEVKDDKTKCTLGNLTVPLSGLLDEEDMTLTQCFPLRNSGPSSSIRFKMALRILSLEKQGSSDQPSSVRVRKSSLPHPSASTRASTSDSPPPHPPTPPPPPPQPTHASSLTLHHRDGEPYAASPLRSVSSLCVAMSASQKHLAHNESTPSLASDISLPFATLELQQRLRQLHNGSTPTQFPLGEVHLTVRHSTQRNKLIVVVHACRNLIAFSKDTSDPFVRLYLLPDKSRTSRRKTGTAKKTLNPVYDQTFEFSVSTVELHRRTLDVAVKNGGNILSKHKGLLGKVLVDLSGEDIAKGWTQWYELSEDGFSSPRSIQDSFT